MKNNTSIYLQRLKFDKKLFDKPYAKYLTNIRLVILLIATVVLLGILGLYNLPRRLNPEVEIPIVLVTTVLPGASPEEIENLVTVPVEDAIKGVENVQTYGSFSQENVSVISIEFTSDSNPDKAKSDIQSAIDGVSGLPDGVITPDVMGIDFENFPVLTFSVKTNSGDISSLLTFSDDLKDKLESDPQIDRVEISGNEKQEIQIYIPPNNVYLYNINPFMLSGQIKSLISTYPAGNTTTDTSNISVSVAKSINSIEDIRQLPVFANYNVYKLGNIAKVSEKSSPNQFTSYIASKDTTAERAVSFSIFKSKNATIEDSAKAATDIAKAETDKFGDSFSIFVISDNSELIDEQFNDLYKSFALTLALVFITLFIFLGIKQSLIVSFSIPLTFLVSFFVMWATGLSLNFLSVFSLLLALGLVVDDAIVISSAMTTYFKTKKFSGNQTGILVWKDFIVPIWSTTITTIWAFVPLLLTTGIIGEFIKTIPVVVSATLLASTSVAVLIILPLIMASFEGKLPKRVVTLFKIILILFLIGIFVAAVPKDPLWLFAIAIALYLAFLGVTYNARKDLGKRAGRISSKITDTGKIKQFFNKYSSGGLVNTTKIQQNYFTRISSILSKKSSRRRVIIITVAFALFSYLLLPLGYVQNEFFPKIDSDNLFVRLELPSGTNRKTTTEEAMLLIDELKTEDDVSFVVLDVGKGGVGFDFGSQPAENQAVFSLSLVDTKIRKNNSIELAKALREKYSQYTKGELQVIEESSGPPVGADVEIKIKGENLQALSEFADSTHDFLESQHGVTNVDISIKPSTSKISFNSDPYNLLLSGTSNDQVGFWLRAYTSGFTLTNIRFEDEEQEVVFRMSKDNPRPEEIGGVQIPTQKGYVPITSFGDLTLEANPTLITREDGERTISVSASVESGYSVNEINQQLGSYADTDLDLVEGYSWKTGGANEENEKSVTSIFQAMTIAAFLILITMVIQLGSFRKSIIVLLVIPLAISGVFIAFALTGTPLSFPALIGLLALFGIVVNNSIMLVEKINQNIASGIKYGAAIADASASRLEPILLSSLTTILGLVPITITDPLWRGLGGAIIAGLTISGVIMLLFIPVVYYSWFEKEEGKKRT